MSMLEVFLFSTLSILLFATYFKVLYEWYRKVKVIPVRTTVNKSSKLESIDKNGKHEVFKQAPGPMPLPIIGNLALLAKYDVPFEGFTELAKIFGDVYTLTLGTTRCLIVNNLDLIREVLNQNGKFFGGRPDFIRFHKLFGGDRNNSLALCDWSHLQQKRRNLARKHCSPRDSSSYYSKMSEVGSFEMIEFMDHLKNSVPHGKDFNIKPLIMQTCANMFSQYMCSVRFDYNDTEFKTMVRHFDEIFWEINQGYAIDFLPWLQPFYLRHLEKLTVWSTEIRSFILNRIINDREQIIDPDEQEKDFTDALLKSFNEDPTVSKNTIIFMLEDFLGGHSAIGNLVMLALGYIVQNPEIGKNIQKEADKITQNGKKKITLNDTEDMPYTVATIFEVLRYASSPIVPHVATEDACIAGYGVTKGTIVFINNYELNTGEKYWNNPKSFQPERFLEEVTIEQTKSVRKFSESSDSGIDENEITETQNKLFKKTEKSMKKILRVKKNIPHFLPFSIGKRTCIGQNLVRCFSFIMLAQILQSYDVSCSDVSLIKTNPACVAVPPDTYPLSFTPRVAA